LTDSGAVAFLVNPPAEGDSHDAAALSQLLTQLLGIDEDGPRQPLPGGLLITISGRLGSVDLPSSTAEGFRLALARFADDSPHALRTLYWRTVTSRSKKGRRVRKAPAAPRQHERRASSAQVNELRRSIRKLEQRVFEWSAVPMPATDHGGRNRMRTRAAVAAAMVLFVASVLTLTGAWFLQPDGMPDNTAAAPVQAQAEAVPTPVDRPAAVTATPVTAIATASGKPAERPRRAVAPPRSRRIADVKRVRDGDEQSAHKRTATFAGGTRGIAWLAP
jgi:hypothetical protein